MSDILVDSNIFIYAINTSSPKHNQARLFLKQTIKNSSLCLAHQNILETMRVLTHPKFPNPMLVGEASRALAKITDYATIISPAPATYWLFNILLRKYARASNFIFDTYLVATALTAGIKVIATDNIRDLGIFKEVKVLNPFAKKGKK